MPGRQMDALREGAPMRNELLTVDGVANLVLGVLLIAFPKGVVVALGIPGGESGFYANILGGVVFGIGVALLIERFRPPLKTVDRRS